MGQTIMLKGWHKSLTMFQFHFLSIRYLWSMVNSPGVKSVKMKREANLYSEWIISVTIIKRSYAWSTIAPINIKIINLNFRRYSFFETSFESSKPDNWKIHLYIIIRKTNKTNTKIIFHFSSRVYNIPNCFCK